VGSILTVSAVRLNSRDYINDWSAIDNPENAINLSSIRIDPLNEAYESKSRQVSQPGTVHHSTALDLGRNKSDHDLEATLEIRKAV
jgi:hypothetical protein